MIHLSQEVTNQDSDEDKDCLKLWQILRLKKRVKRLERQRKSSTSQPRRRKYGQVESLDDDLDEEDASKQGMKNDKTNLMLHESDFDGFDDETVDAATTGISTGEPRTPPTTTIVFDGEDVTMAMAQTLIKVKEEKAKEKRVAFKYVKYSFRPSDAELAHRLHEEELAEIERIQKEKGAQEEVLMAAIYEEYDTIQASIDAAQRKFRAAQRAVKIRSRPHTKTQLRNLMMTYLKNMGGYKHSQLKGKTYEEIQGLYEREQKFIHDFVPMDSKKEEKKLMEPESEGKKKEEAVEYEKEKEELRADGSSSYYGDMQAFLRRLDRQDLNDLYRLVQERFQDHPLEGHDLLLWGDLRICGVHTLFMDGTPMEINMLVEKKYSLIKELLEKMMNLQLEAEEESTMAFELIRSYALSWKPCQGDSLNLPDHRIRRRCCSLIPAKSDS
ncbi:hypothetical protein Tco_1215191 [Tanacetum coccineum]